MRVDCITKVEFKTLDKQRWDRRGIIAIFHLREVPNWQYIQYMALKFLWTLTSLLSEHYSVRGDDKLNRDDYFSEGNECWITPGYFEGERYQIRLSHKYWSDKQVECFKQLIRSLAVLHGWEVTEELGKYCYRNLPVTESGWYVGGLTETGGGILEWCVDEEDAHQMLEKMRPHGEFRKLSIGRWT